MGIHKHIKFGFILLSALFLANCASQPHYFQNKVRENSIKVNLALKEDIPSKHVSTHVGYGYLQAAGFVDDKEQLRKVSNILEQHKGQNQVINNVKILKPGDDEDDENLLRDNVINLLKRSNVPTHNIKSQVRNGHVILSGFMNKHVEMNHITGLVEQMPGVHKVDNFILYRQIDAA